MTTTAELPAWAGVQRPGRADARRNFDALVAAARESFAEHGIGASLEEIAKRAGVGIGTLYRNFPTRDALIEAVYVAEVERLVEVAHEAAAGTPWGGFETWLLRFVDYIGTKRVLIEGMNRESAVLQSCRTAMYDAGAPLLARAQQAGVVRPDTSIEDVVRLVSGVIGAVYPDDATRDRVLGLAIDGIRTH